jgi:hypothetical protein
MSFHGHRSEFSYISKADMLTAPILTGHGPGTELESNSISSEM